MSIEQDFLFILEQIQLRPNIFATCKFRIEFASRSFTATTASATTSPATATTESFAQVTSSLVALVMWSSGECVSYGSQFDYPCISKENRNIL